ncbi:MAG: hypothetical protein ACC631_06700 [Halocynthiibacter sp.]
MVRDQWRAEADFCVEALNGAIHRFGPPEIMNTDQGSQFTSFVWTDRLKRIGSRISMDAKGRFPDDILVERLWRSLQYECVYLHAWLAQRRMRALANGWSSTTKSARIPHLAASHPQWSTGRELKKSNPISSSRKQLERRQILSNVWGVAQ